MKEIIWNEFSEYTAPVGLDVGHICILGFQLNLH